MFFFLHPLFRDIVSFEIGHKQYKEKGRKKMVWVKRKIIGKKEKGVLKSRQKLGEEKKNI